MANPVGIIVGLTLASAGAAATTVVVARKAQQNRQAALAATNASGTAVGPSQHPTAVGGQGSSIKGSAAAQAHQKRALVCPNAIVGGPYFAHPSTDPQGQGALEQALVAAQIANINHGSNGCEVSVKKVYSPNMPLPGFVAVAGRVQNLPSNLSETPIPGSEAARAEAMLGAGTPFSRGFRPPIFAPPPLTASELGGFGQSSSQQGTTQPTQSSQGSSGSSQAQAQAAAAQAAAQAQAQAAALAAQEQAVAQAAAAAAQAAQGATQSTAPSSSSTGTTTTTTTQPTQQTPTIPAAPNCPAGFHAVYSSVLNSWGCEVDPQPTCSPGFHAIFSGGWQCVQDAPPSCGSGQQAVFVTGQGWVCRTVTQPTTASTQTAFTCPTGYTATIDVQTRQFICVPNAAPASSSTTSTSSGTSGSGTTTSAPTSGPNSSACKSLAAQLTTAQDNLRIAVATKQSATIASLQNSIAAIEARMAALSC